MYYKSVVARDVKSWVLYGSIRFAIAEGWDQACGVLQHIVACMDWAPEGGPVYASSAAIQELTQNWHGPAESDCLIKTKPCDRPPTGVDTIWFLPTALNVNVKKFKKAWVNCRSNYDSLTWLWVQGGLCLSSLSPLFGGLTWVLGSHSATLHFWPLEHTLI